MTNEFYNANQVSQTLCMVMIGGLLTGLSSVSDGAVLHSRQDYVLGTSVKYNQIHESTPLLTTSRFHNFYSNHSEELSFEQEMSCFYVKLFESQEELGREFEVVLFENIMDLYQN